MSAEKLVPKLRFSGFDDEWKNKNGHEAFDLLGGGSFKSSDSVSNGVKWLKIANVGINEIKTKELSFLPSDFLEKFEKYVLKKEDVILALTRPILHHELKIAKVNDEFNNSLLNQRVGKLINKEDVYLNFIYYYLQLPYSIYYLESKISGSDPPNLSNKDLLSMPINLPNINEQKKISNFLSRIDEKIELLYKKHHTYQEFKKYLMQQIFAQKLRFDFDDEWKKVKLKNIVERVTRKNTNLETDLALTISAEYGLIDQEEFFNKIVASKSLKNYYLVKKGEFAYNKSYSNGYPYGAIKRLDNYPMGALSTLYICFKPTNISSDYLKEYFETTFWYKEIYSIAVEGARNHGLLNINVNDFFNTKHLIPPSTEEQEKIANLFKSINSKIDAVNNDLILVKNFKKGLLQHMFV